MGETRKLRSALLLASGECEREEEKKKEKREKRRENHGEEGGRWEEEGREGR